MSFENFEKQLNGMKSVSSSATPVSGSSSAFDSFEGQVGLKPANIKERAPQGDGMLMGMAKGLVSAPATMIARPLQAAQSAVQLAGMDIKGNEAKAKELSDEAYRLSLTLRGAPESEKEVIRAKVQDLNNQAMVISKKLGEDAKWKPSAGGIIAEAPETFADVKKDVGRGIETIALGMGGPLTSGAAFGFGSSLEQGNDVFSMDTLNSTLLGMGFAKGASVIGKPLFNAAGKTIGFVTPKILKDAVSKGYGAVDDLMKNTKLIEGRTIPGTSYKIPQIAEKMQAKVNTFEDAVNKKASEVLQKTGTALKNQYAPQKEAITKHYEDVEVDRLMPGKDKVYNKAQDVVNDAQKRGIDIKQQLKNNKVYGDEHIIDGKYDTKATAEALVDEAKNGGAEFLRPALRAADPGVQRTSIGEVRDSIISEIRAQPDSVLSPKQKLDFISNVSKEYSGRGAEAMAFRNGYGLEDLYNSKLQRVSGLYRTPKSGGVSTISDTLTSQQKEIESRIFDRILREKAPKSLKLDDYFKAQESKFVLANYLNTIHNTKANLSIPAKIFRKTAQLTGGTLGYKTFGPLGIFNGYQFGGLMADTFSSLPNPIKLSYLKSINKTAPEIYNIMKEYVSSSEARRMVTPILKAGDKMKANYPVIELGPPDSGPANTFYNDIVQKNRTMFNTKMLPGRNENVIITPNRSGTPNYVGAPYSPGGDMGAVGGLRQRIANDYNISIAEWKASGTKLPYDSWINKNKPLFESTSKKVDLPTVANPQLEQEIMDLELRIDLLDDAIKNNPINNIGNKKTTVTRKVTNKDGSVTYKQSEKKVNPLSAFYNKKEGGFRELGDIRNSKTSKSYEDAMASVGIDEPLEFMRRVNEANEQKINLKNLKAYVKNLKKNPNRINQPESDITPDEINF